MIKMALLSEIIEDQLSKFQEGDYAINIIPIWKWILDYDLSD